MLQSRQRRENIIDRLAANQLPAEQKAETETRLAESGAGAG